MKFGPWWDEEQREAPRPGADVDAQLDPVGVDQRKTALISEKIDVEVILPDRRQSKALLTPREISFTELDRTRRGREPRQQARRLGPSGQRMVVDRNGRVRQPDNPWRR